MDANELVIASSLMIVFSQILLRYLLACMEERCGLSCMPDGNVAVARRLCHIFLFNVQQMNIPLATFWLENVINQELDRYPRVVMILIFVAAQSVAIPYFCTAAVWHGTEQLASAIGGKSSAHVVENTETFSSSLFQLYRHPYRGGEVESFNLVEDVKGWCLDLFGYGRRVKVAVVNEENEEGS
jgi:hypothetical protein